MPEVLNQLPYQVDTLLIAGNKGACMGVNTTVTSAKLVHEMVDGREPVFHSHPPVHNDKIVNHFRTQGARFIEEEGGIGAVPNEGILFQSAHGSVEDLYREIADRQILNIDGTCRLVTRVKDNALEAQARGEFVVYIGGKPNHPERRAVTSYLDPENFVALEHLEEVDLINVPDDKLLNIHLQTTVGKIQTAPIIQRLEKRFGVRVIVPSKWVCYATDNRQDAFEELTQEEIDKIVVMGSASSHNTTQLRKLGEAAGIPTIQINGIEDIDEDTFRDGTRRVGLTSGASVDNADFREVVDFFQRRNARIGVLQPVRGEKSGAFPLPLDDLRKVQERYPTKKDGTVVVFPDFKHAEIQLWNR